MAEERIQRRLAAILAADVVGYSRLMGKDEAGTRARFNDQLDQIVRPAIDEHRGRLANTMGDGFLVEFGSVVDAVQGALDIQNGTAMRNRDQPEDRKLLLRIGIHLGDVIVEGEDIHGDGVNLAARLEGLAQPGGICVSDMVHAGVRNKLSIRFDDLGEQSLKNIADPLQVFRVILEKGNAEGASASDASFRRPAVAVLPFENMSGDPEQEYFADGMAEEIITALSRIDMLFVIARNSSFTYKGRAVDIRQIARELGVRYVLEGSVRRASNRVRITGQLIEAASGAHLWADKFDGALEDIFDLQDQIAESVVGVIEPTLRTAEIERSKRKRPESLDAYDLYLRALPLVFAFRREDNQRAIDLLDQAIEIDPGMATALALKGWCIGQRNAAGWSAFSLENRAQAVALARAAIAADDQNATALATAGFALVTNGREFRPGVAAARRAVELNNNSAYVCMHAGACLYFNNQPDEAIALLQRARRLSPVDQLTYHILHSIAGAHIVARRPQEAYEHALASIAENDQWPISLRMLACACGHLGRLEEAKEIVTKIITLAPDTTISGLREWLPYRDIETREYFLDGLIKAGLPE